MDNNSNNVLEAQPSTNEIVKEAIPKQDKSDFSVLVVDDEQTIRKIVLSILESEGYTCKGCSSPIEALQWIGESHYDFVITDIRMSGMSGLEFAKQIARDHKHVLVGFMSGFQDFTILKKAIKFDPVGFVDKPFDPADLIKLTNRAFQRHCESQKKEQIRTDLESEVEANTREIEFRTERLAVEQTLIHGIINNANFGMIATDTEGSIHLMNALASEMLGMKSASEESYVGLPLADIISGTLPAIFTKLMKDVLDCECLHEIDCINGPNDTMLNIISYPAFYSQKVCAIVFVVHDVTEKQVLQRQILQSSKLASIGELAAGVAHEINNPLGFVMSNCNSLVEYLNAYKTYVSSLESQISTMKPDCDCELIKKKTQELREELDIAYISEDALSLLEETQTGLTRMSKIVADLKTFAHADKIIPERAQVNTLIDDSLNLVKNQTKYNLEIIKEFKELPEITCFPNQLVQVFTNIFVNASHAVEDKGTLTIKTSASKRAVTVSIEDSGKGIPEKQLSKIFDPFYTTKEPGKGTGMGLSISYNIIEKHGGTIIVSSEVGVGTRFDIVLPIHRSDGMMDGKNE